MRDGNYTFFMKKHDGLSCLRAGPTWPKSYWAVPGPMLQHVGWHGMVRCVGQAVPRPCQAVPPRWPPIAASYDSRTYLVHARKTRNRVI